MPFSTSFSHRSWAGQELADGDPQKMVDLASRQFICRGRLLPLSLSGETRWRPATAIVVVRYVVVGNTLHGGKSFYDREQRKYIFFCPPPRRTNPSRLFPPPPFFLSLRNSTSSFSSLSAAPIAAFVPQIDFFPAGQTHFCPNGFEWETPLGSQCLRGFLDFIY